jgi:hypothetical protein
MFLFQNYSQKILKFNRNKMAYIKNLYQNKKSLYLNGNSTSESSVDKGLLFSLYSLNYFLIMAQHSLKNFNNF